MSQAWDPGPPRSIWRLIWGIAGGVFLALRGAVKPGDWLIEAPPAGGSSVEARP